MGCYQTKKKNRFQTQESLAPNQPTSIKGDLIQLNSKGSEYSNLNSKNQGQSKERNKTESEQISSRKYINNNTLNESQYFKQVRNLGFVYNFTEVGEEKNKSALLQSILTPDDEDKNFSPNNKNKPKIDELIDHLRRKRETEKRKSRYSIQYLKKII